MLRACWLPGPGGRHRRSAGAVGVNGPLPAGWPLRMCVLQPSAALCMVHSMCSPLRRHISATVHAADGGRASNTLVTSASCFLPAGTCTCSGLCALGSLHWYRDAARLIWTGTRQGQTGRRREVQKAQQRQQQRPPGLCLGCRQAGGWGSYSLPNQRVVHRNEKEWERFKVEQQGRVEMGWSEEEERSTGRAE